MRQRRGARVLLVCGPEVLLLNDSDPGVPGLSWWVVPGGGIDAGEPAREAAAREIAEETGLILAPGELTGPVARGRVCHGYTDRILVQDEVFFTAHVSRFEPSTAGWTESERRRRVSAGGRSTPCPADSGLHAWLTSLHRIRPIRSIWQTGRSRRCR